MIRWPYAAIVMVAVLTGCATGDWSSDTPTKGSAKLSRSTRVNLNKQNVSDLGAPSDNLWLRIRDGFQMEPVDSPLIVDQTVWLASRPDYVQRSMKRSSPYLFYIVQEVNARNMPTELALLPFVESAFNPQAKSGAKAMGIWQFMPKTGKDFQLTQNVFRDERRDVLQSTDAALDYLNRLHTQFGSWELALAAYNWGSGNILKAQKRNLAAGLPTDYWSLSMPLETRAYVPKLMAYRALVLDPAAFGVTLPDLENHPYFIAVDVNNDIDVALAAKLAEMSVDEFKTLNPSFNKPVILSAANQQILLPFGHAEVYQENLKKYNKPLSTWTAVKVAQTQSAEATAQSLGVDLATLREINGIPKGMRIKAGSTVIIPKTSRRPGDISVALAETASLSLEKPPPPPKKTKKGAAGRGSGKTKESKSASKGNSSSNKATTQHKSASTGLAKSAKKDPIKTSSN